ncbi:MAG: hypothetical protein KDJ26_08365 [Alphaproteobacteria bacterium]|jgi:uncharacterized membrane protein (DUF106 family)|nr:hypothetical protein [Alphaproteobacteria bacterium]
MFRMSKLSISFCIFFALLTLAALGHDVFIWQRDGNVFTLADLGGIFKRYAPEAFNVVVEMVGADTFNMILTPLLAQTAVYVGLALLVISVVIGLAVSGISRLVGKEDQMSKLRKQAEKKDFRSYKDRVKYKRH